MIILRVDTFEAKETEPVLTHLFYGESTKECEDLLAAHMKYDAFLRASLTTNRFSNFAVRSTKTWETTL